ncbi:MAG: phage holin family protein [Bacteroidetes bacterium]|nr:phage holin family protein [Bacteroidota bacterium]
MGNDLSIKNKMDASENLIEPLFDRVKEYGKTSVELIKLKAVDRSSDFLSKFIFQLVISIFLLLGILSLNIAAALWIGDLLGKTYFGFLSVTGFYVLLAIILLLFRKKIKMNISNSIITSLTTALCKKSQQ